MILIFVLLFIKKYVIYKEFHQDLDNHIIYSCILILISGIGWLNNDLKGKAMKRVAGVHPAQRRARATHAHGAVQSLVQGGKENI